MKTEGPGETELVCVGQLFWIVARQRDKQTWCGVCHKFHAQTWKEGKINPGGGGAMGKWVNSPRLILPSLICPIECETVRMGGGGSARRLQICGGVGVGRWNFPLSHQGQAHAHAPMSRELHPRPLSCHGALPGSL